MIAHNKKLKQHYEVPELTTQSFFRSILYRHKLAISLLVFIAVFWAIDLSLRSYLLKIIIDTAQDTIDHISWGTIIYPIAISLFLTIFHNFLFRLYDYLIIKFTNYFEDILKLPTCFRKNYLVPSEE